MEKEIKFTVLLHPAYRDAFGSRKIISEDGLIQCFSLQKDGIYLDLDARLYDPPEADKCVHLSIPHSAVLCILSTSEIDSSKILGFRDSP